MGQDLGVPGAQPQLHDHLFGVLVAVVPGEHLDIITGVMHDEALG